jgi:hypothetical protein
VEIWRQNGFTPGLDRCSFEKSTCKVSSNGMTKLVVADGILEREEREVGFGTDIKGAGGCKFMVLRG